MDKHLYHKNLGQIISYLAYEHVTFRRKASKIANHLRIPLVFADLDLVLANETSLLSKYYLHMGYLGLSLRSHSSPSQGPIYCDFISKKLNYRIKHGGGNGQALAKAIGVTGKCKPKVIDLTAGLGTDSFILASLGCKILMLERNPIIYELLYDGLARAVQRATVNRELACIMNHVNLTKIDALHYFAKLAPNNKFDVIYLDPMFDLPIRMAKVKKEMNSLHNIIGADNDADKLLEKAMERAKYRVVVKRSKKSPNLANIKPNLVLGGKSTRYDIYTVRRLPRIL
ncbi:MAG: hypothetical protein CBC09_07560 [Cellvibrionales bacterium TMED49]|nr:SAM-dependent methyltransferase [Porticoccaceae bacterium]OUU36996.1 MAG: hypothetical protein CBC09_07560 [Cellvibrionales bacterium TMED49]|tara:strand:- start:4 stop:858 length:855 start_codon:yes stop_codon:yes gene_type:complete